MAQFVLKIEKLSHIMGPTPILERSPSPIMAPDDTWLKRETIKTKDTEDDGHHAFSTEIYRTKLLSKHERKFLGIRTFEITDTKYVHYLTHSSLFQGVFNTMHVHQAPTMADLTIFSARLQYQAPTMSDPALFVREYNIRPRQCQMTRFSCATTVIPLISGPNE